MAQPRYYADADAGADDSGRAREHEPLDRPSFHPRPTRQDYQQPYQEYFQQQQQQQQQRRQQDPPAHQQYQEYERGSSSAPQPLVHQSSEHRQWRPQNHGYPPRQRSGTRSNIPPGSDNFSEAAAGGMAGVAFAVAESKAGEIGLDGVRNPDYAQQSYSQQGQWQNSDHGFTPQGTRRGYYHIQQAPAPQPYPQPPYAGNPTDRYSNASSTGLNAAAVAPGMATPGVWTPSRSPQSFGTEAYSDDPYQNLSAHQHSNLGMVNPDEIDDDADDGVNYGRKGPRTSMLSLGGSSHKGLDAAVAAGAVGAAAGAGGVMGALAGRNGSGGLYAPVSSPANGADTSAYNLAYNPGNAGRGLGEKSRYRSSGGGARGRKWRLIILILIGVLVVVGVALGIVFGSVLKRDNGSGSKAGSGSSPSGDGGDSAGDLNSNSPEIQALMNNANLHRVFPGIDYTPLNTQYPDCLSNPPSQNNITKDVAVLSQLTSKIRLYGTDCNQTQMVIHALNQLGLNGTIKIWLGVWQDKNATTNARQLSQMWNILDQYGAEPFEGLIVANEILFRQQMTVTELGDLLNSVRTNASSNGWNLPVATSDLGDNWTSELAAASDYIMANIHPFFGGVNAHDGASWTWSFWEEHNKGFFKSDNSKNVISETGWPSQGGTDCGTTSVTSCPDAAVAGISQMNQFMSDWVCQALTNGTQYFWFEAFDEPWKIAYDSGDENWEDHWGLMDVDRNLKDGVKIPDCGGKTVR